MDARRQIESKQIKIDTRQVKFDPSNKQHTDYITQRTATFKNSFEDLKGTDIQYTMIVGMFSLMARIMFENMGALILMCLAVAWFVKVMRVTQAEKHQSDIKEMITLFKWSVTDAKLTHEKWAQDLAGVIAPHVLKAHHSQHPLYEGWVSKERVSDSLDNASPEFKSMLSKHSLYTVDTYHDKPTYPDRTPLSIAAAVFKAVVYGNAEWKDLGLYKVLPQDDRIQGGESKLTAQPHVDANSAGYWCSIQ